MNKRTLHRMFSVLAALAMGLSLLTGCGTKSAEQVQEQEDAQTIQVYLWTTGLYENYAPYIQAQLPDVSIEFIVGNNDLDFYKFLQQNGGLPDIITCCRFSLHDAAPLKDSLMNLALTNEAGAVYNTYLNSFKNEDGSVNWLPVCADAHGFVVNRSLFEQYDIPLPTDYESFVSACQAFEKVGIRGFTADYAYDYTCMETLQGLSAAELTTTEGRKWRTAYSDPASTARVGLDNAVWPGAFERMEQFIQDTHLTADDLAQTYDDVMDLYRNGEVAMYFGSSAGVKKFQDEGIDTTFLPFFSQNGEKWIMTTPYFQVALNRELEQDTARRSNAMKVLNVMLSEEAQNRIVADGQDVLSYSQNVPLRLTDYMKDVRSVVEENHMYIRIASNDFFAISKDVVSKMIAGIVAVHHGHLAVPVILDILALDQGRDVHAAGQNGGVAVGAALAGDEAQQQAIVHAHRLGRGQILGHQNAGLGALQAGIVHPLQNVQDRLCNVDDVRTAGLQIRVIHGCEHGSLIVAGGLDSVLGALVLAVDDLLDGVHKVVIFQHHGVDVEHFGNVLACFGQCLFVQSSLLLNGFLLGSLKAGHLCSGVGDLCGGDHGVLFLIDLQLADGNAVQNASTGAYLHRSFSFLLIHFKKAPADHSARAVASRRDQTFSVRNF